MFTQKFHLSKSINARPWSLHILAPKTTHQNVHDDHKNIIYDQYISSRIVVFAPFRGQQLVCCWFMLLGGSRNHFYILSNIGARKQKCYFWPTFYCFLRFLTCTTVHSSVCRGRSATQQRRSLCATLQYPIDVMFSFCNSINIFMISPFQSLQHI